MFSMSVDSTKRVKIIAPWISAPFLIASAGSFYNLFSTEDALVTIETLMDLA